MDSSTIITALNRYQGGLMNISGKTSWLIAALLVFALLSGALWWVDTPRVDTHAKAYDRVGIFPSR